MTAVLTVYCWLLCLYPGSYRDEFGQEMTSVFCEARIALPPALDVKVRFYRREFTGLLLGILLAHFDHLFGRRFYMQPQFRFPRSTVFLMLLIFAGVVVTIAEGSSVAGATLGSGWRSLVSVLVLMLLTMWTAAAVVWGILHAMRRSGVHRLQNLHS